jgi:protein gp37
LKIFICDMADLFAEFVLDEWLDRIFAIVADHPKHIYQVLTKRPERQRDYFSTHRAPSNLWVGTSIEQRRHLDRLDALRATPAAVRYASFEPLLEDLGELDLTGIPWAIAGAESGYSGRPIQVEWVRSIRRGRGVLPEAVHGARPQDPTARTRRSAVAPVSDRLK